MMVAKILFGLGALLVMMGLGIPFLDGSLFGYAKKVNDRVREVERKIRDGISLSLDEINEKKAVDCGKALKRWGINASLVGVGLVAISLILQELF
ncbi:MAG TPA: hypothetical protein VF616_04075 [Duganella sp.]|uniref:hypothetical protein n=1 Tax=Duganella sp. TaxID=1904440 RepID=UPI002ED3E4CF